MKRKTVSILLAVAVVSATLLSGCSGDGSIKTDDLTISQYKNIEVDTDKEADEVTDEDVETQIETILKSNLESAAEGYEVQDGDTVSIEYVGKIDGEEFDGGSTTAPTDLEIGSDSYIDGFEDSCIGHKKGDTFDWNGAFPDDYSNTDYAGKDVTFTITIDDIKVVPELTDEQVQKLSEDSKTVKEYKKEIKKSLEETAKETAKSNYESAIWQAVLDNATVNAYPEDEVQELCDSAIEQYTSYAEAYGMTYEDLIQNYYGQSTDDFESSLEESAKDVVKQEMVVEAIADQEKIAPTDEEYEEEYENMAATYGYSDVDSMKDAASEDDLKDAALANIVKNWVVEHAKDSSSK